MAVKSSSKTFAAYARTAVAVAIAAIYANPTVVSVGGTFSVSAGAVVYPENEPVTGRRTRQRSFLVSYVKTVKESTAR